MSIRWMAIVAFIGVLITGAVMVTLEQCSPVKESLR